MKKAVIYTRFSNDRLQDGRSIEDQVAEAEITAQRNDYAIIRVYEDRGISGEGMIGRRGLQAMMKAAKTGEFDAVIVESTSRISRDEEHMQRIFKRLSHFDVAILTRNGVVSKIQASVDGIVNAQFVENLRTSVRRSMNGRVREGLIPGKVAYGYRGVIETLPNGLRRFAPGVRQIDPEKAVVVLRIFQEYGDGRSPREIAAGLTKDGIPSPLGGRHWNPGKIVSGGNRAGCLLSNELYIGRLIWNKTTYRKDPDTEQREARPGKPEDIIVKEVPNLRIVPQPIWDRAHARRKALSLAKFGAGGLRRHNVASAEKYILVGLLRCQKCGSNMGIGNSNMDGTPRVVCSKGHRRMGCDHHKSYSLQGLEDHVLAKAKEILTDPEQVMEYTRGYQARWAERQKEFRSNLAAVERDLGRIEGQIINVVDAIANASVEAARHALGDKLNKLELEKATLSDRKNLIQAEGSDVDLDPRSVDKFCKSMTELHDMLTGKVRINDLARAHAAFRNVFEKIVVVPTGKRKPYEVDPWLRLAAVGGIDLFPKARTYQQIIDDEGIPDSRICEPSASRWYRKSVSGGNVIPLGRWRQAA